MKRLSSYFAYGFIFFVPPAIALSIYLLSRDMTLSVYISIPVVIILSWWGFVLYNTKRIYMKGSIVYIYSLFSNKHTIINKDRYGEINKVLFYDPNFYCLLYYDDNNNGKNIYFMRNYLLDNFTDIIEELNSVE
jgi:hypothetical protein